jgi:hypothetical protein
MKYKVTESTGVRLPGRKVELNEVVTLSKEELTLVGSSLDNWFEVIKEDKEDPKDKKVVKEDPKDPKDKKVD